MVLSSVGGGRAMAINCSRCGSSRDVALERPGAGAARQGRRPAGIPLGFQGSRTTHGGVPVRCFASEQRPPISSRTLREGPLVEVWTHHRWRFPLPPHHRFPIEKYGLLAERLVADGLAAPDELREAPPVEWGELAAVHDRGLLSRIREGRLTLREQRVLVLDCDVHQGDGTADICAEDPLTFTLSLHGARNYPFTRVPSDLDVDIASGTGDDRYLRALSEALDFALPRSRPDFAFYLAGADPFEGDRLGRLALSKTGLRARDELALDRLTEAGAAVCVVLAGGYAVDIGDTVDINAATAAAVAKRVRPA